MSIIQEALKKATEGSAAAAETGADTSRGAKATEAIPATKNGIQAFAGKYLQNRNIAFFFYLSAGVFFIIYIFALFQSSNKPADDLNYSVKPITDRTPAPAIKAAGKAAGRPNPLAAVLTGRPRSPNFVLNGIMQLVDGPRAIINNVIVGIGDVIGGAMVERIDKDSVVLKTRDSEITIGMR